MKYDVIISGAGPVGLFLATELALAKCRVLVLEKTGDADSPLKRLPFGIRGLSAPTLAAFARRGLLEEFRLHREVSNPNLGSGPRRPGGHFAGIQFMEADVDLARWPHHLGRPQSLMSEMREVESILARRAERLGVEIERGCAVTDFAQDADGVTVHAGDRTFAAKWLVGTDGARSVVRKRGGFTFAGTEPEFTGYTMHVDLADPGALKMGRNPTPNGMYVQAQPGYLTVQDFDGGAFHDSAAPLDLEHLRDVLRRVSGTDATPTRVHLATTWTDRARQATEYRRGRVLLAGDAAHIHSPLGGQGLNLGIGDAANLGWKLAAEVTGRASSGLLDSYHDERHPIGAHVLNWSRAQVALMRPDPGSRALHEIARDLMQTQDGATYFAGRVWGVSTRHAIKGEHPLVGYPAPNFTFADRTTLDERARDGRGLFVEKTSTAAGEDLARGYDLNHAAGLVDAGGLTALVIRPDGLVAWASDGATPPDDVPRLWLTRRS